jgi:hypothetical protein
MWPARATVGRQPSRCACNLGGFFMISRRGFLIRAARLLTAAFVKDARAFVRKPGTPLLAQPSRTAHTLYWRGRDRRLPDGVGTGASNLFVPRQSHRCKQVSPESMRCRGFSAHRRAPNIIMRLCGKPESRVASRSAGLTPQEGRDVENGVVDRLSRRSGGAVQIEARSRMARNYRIRVCRPPAGLASGCVGRRTL